MNLTLGCEFTKPTKSRAHLSLRQVRFESGAPFTGMSLANYRTVLGSLSRSNIVTFQPFHRTSIFSFILGISKRANQNKESGGLVTTSARGWARRSNSLEKKKNKKNKVSEKKRKKKTLRSSLVTILFVFYFILFNVLKDSNHFKIQRNLPILPQFLCCLAKATDPNTVF